MESQTSDFVSHDLNDKYTAVRCCCCMNTVDCIRSNIYRTLETKCHICSINIIIDRFWQMNDIQTFFSQKIGCLLRSVSTKNNQTVQTQFVIGLLHGFNLIQSFFIRHAHQFERLTGCTKYRTTAGQNSGKIFCCEHMIFSIDQSFISVIKSINFQVFHCI